jgi:hypothetical protein
MFPPGYARFVTIPLPMGSPIAPITMGIVAVACFAASTALVPQVRMTSTLRLTRSFASSGSRSLSPLA